MKRETISITFNGEIDHDINKWSEWYNDAKVIIDLFGYKPSHLGVRSTTLNSRKVMTLQRNEKKLINAIKSGDKIKSISIYSLPNNYKSASFDYNVLLVRNFDYVTLVVNKSDFYRVDEEILVNYLRKYIKIEHGEIYEMDKSEVPLIYAAKANEASSFKTLKILKNLE